MADKYTPKQWAMAQNLARVCRAEPLNCPFASCPVKMEHKTNSLCRTANPEDWIAHVVSGDTKEDE